MSSLIKQVFYIIGIVLISLLLFTAIYGDYGRMVMWNAMYNAYINYWDAFTWGEGDRINEVMTSLFESTNDLTTE